MKNKQPRGPQSGLLAMFGALTTEGSLPKYSARISGASNYARHNVR